jgi:hypothetical protein
VFDKHLLHSSTWGRIRVRPASNGSDGDLHRLKRSHLGLTVGLPPNPNPI